METIRRLKKSKALLFISLSLITMGCQSGYKSDESVNSTASPTPTASSTPTPSRASLSLGASNLHLTVGKTRTFRASGGYAPYSYSVGNDLGFIDSETGLYTAPSTTLPNGPKAEIVATDSKGNQVSIQVIIDTDLAISPSTISIKAGSTTRFEVTGGNAPYEYSVLFGGGSFSGDVYTAPAVNVLARVQVADADGNVARASVQVTDGDASLEPDPDEDKTFQTNFNTKVDHAMGFTYAVQSGKTHPFLVFFSTGMSTNKDSIKAGTGDCKDSSGGNLGAPCAQKIALNNFNVTKQHTKTYKAHLSFFGRTGLDTLDFCIDPSDSAQARIKVTSSNHRNWGCCGNKGADHFFQTIRYDIPGYEILDGAQIHAHYSKLDTASGAGNVNVIIQEAGFTDDTSCGSNFDDDGSVAGVIAKIAD